VDAVERMIRYLVEGSVVEVIEVGVFVMVQV